MTLKLMIRLSISTSDEKQNHLHFLKQGGKIHHGNNNKKLYIGKNRENNLDANLAYTHTGDD